MPHSWLPGFRIAVVLMLVVVEHNRLSENGVSATNMRAQSVYCPRVVTAKTQYNLKNARNTLRTPLRRRLLQ